MLGRAPSGDAEVPSQSLADHGRGRLVVAASARGERLAQLGSEANGLNGRRGCTHRRPAAAPAADLVRGRTGRGPLAQFGDGVVGNRLFSCRLAVVLPRHVNVRRQAASTWVASSSRGSPTECRRLERPRRPRASQRLDLARARGGGPRRGRRSSWRYGCMRDSSSTMACCAPTSEISTRNRASKPGYTPRDRAKDAILWPDLSRNERKPPEMRAADRPHVAVKAPQTSQIQSWRAPGSHPGGRGFESP